MAITYTGIAYTTMVYLWSSPLSQHHRVWTSHVGLHEQCMAKVYIFPRSSSTLGDIRRGRWARGSMLIWATTTPRSL